jgi:hypothetical protein
MGLETFWFCLIAVLWAGYFLLEGFDFGVGMLLPCLPARGSERERGMMFESIGPVWDGNEVWAGRGRRRDVRGVPDLVRDDVLRLLHRPAAGPGPSEGWSVVRRVRDARSRSGRPGARRRWDWRRSSTTTGGRRRLAGPGHLRCRSALLVGRARAGRSVSETRRRAASRC